MENKKIKSFNQEYKEKGFFGLALEVLGLVFVMSLCFGSIWLIPVLSNLLGK